jgi:hypothetical protein
MSTQPLPPIQRSNPEPQIALTYDPEPRRDWVRAVYLGLLLLVFIGVIAFACYANQFGDWTKAKDLLAVVLPALTGLIGAGTAFYFKNSGS